MFAKPSGSNSSKGVLGLDTEEEYQVSLQVPREDWIVQEFVEGPAYSLAVIGTGGSFRGLQVTDLKRDASCDCKRVLASTDLSPHFAKELESIAITIARTVRLKGIMNVKVVLLEGFLRNLETSAKLPSQTPSAVYKLTGQNILEWMCEVFLAGRLPGISVEAQSAVIYEHICVHGGVLEIAGAQVMTKAGPLRYCEGFFGADEAPTNFEPSRASWNRHPDHDSAYAQRKLGSTANGASGYHARLRPVILHRPRAGPAVHSLGSVRSVC